MQEIDKLFDLREKSIEDDLIVEDLTQKILQLLQKHQPNLHVDYVIESLTKLGITMNEAKSFREILILSSSLNSLFAAIL